MHDYQREFLDLAIELDVLRFGDFTLKSGRQSPYFFNAGLFNTGRAADALGRAYASAVANSTLAFDGLFGPAYKGIPLVALTAAALAREHAIDRPFTFNRKEAKAHGEGGTLIGAPLAGRVLIVDDVMTAGTAVREAVDVIEAAGARLAGVVISLDRQERGRGELSATEEVAQDYGIDVISIVTLADLIEHLSGRDGYADTVYAIRGYRREYGSAAALSR